MIITYLMWLLAALFVATCLPLALTEDEQWQRLWGGIRADVGCCLAAPQQRTLKGVCRKLNNSKRSKKSITHPEWLLGGRVNELT